MERKTKIAIVIILAAIATTAVLTITWGIIQDIINTRVVNRVELKTINIKIHYENDSRVTYIDWGLVNLNETVNMTMYATSDSNIDIRVMTFTDHWVPSVMVNYTSVWSNLDDTIMKTGETKELIFYMYIDPQLAIDEPNRIGEFSYEITIAGTEENVDTKVNNLKV